MGPLLALAIISAGPGPTDQTLIHYNARMALREGHPDEALKLWLLRNAVESETRVVSADDSEFRSVTWAALGRLGLCPDGFSPDDQGAGLWPIALHNWVVRNMRRPPPVDGPSPFEAFALGRQQRWVSLHDVLDAAELDAVVFRRSSCWQAIRLTLLAGEDWDASLGDRQVTARVLRRLLRQGAQTLAADRVVGRAVIESRLFDLNLRISGLRQRAGRRARRDERRQGRSAGLSKAEMAEHHKAKAPLATPTDSEAGRLLRGSLQWPAQEWMTLSADRRQFLFAHAVATQLDPGATRALKLAVIDRLIDSGQGGELHTWIAHLASGDDEASKRRVWAGDRGRRLLALDDKTGFRERGVIALHRGIEDMAAGRLPEALRAIAHSVRWADGSRAGDDLRNLGRRWLSFVASQFRVTDELFAMLRAVVPRGDYRGVIEDQLWHAALQADEVSFERCVAQQSGRGALVRRTDLLRPLANGDAGAFEFAIREGMADAPHSSLRLLKQYVERLQAEEAGTRLQHVPLLRRLQTLLSEASAVAAAESRKLRQADVIAGAMRALIDGAVGVLRTPQGGAGEGLSPDREVFGGSLRVAPSDALPWPFHVADAKAPPVFTPIELRPVEWRTQAGQRVFGWRIGD